MLQNEDSATIYTNINRSSKACSTVKGTSKGAWTVGTLLRHSRESAGLEVYDVANCLCIRPTQLVAIENGQFNELPGIVYAVGFIRTYADFMQLDSDEVVRLLKEEMSGREQSNGLNFPSAVQEGKLPSNSILLSAILLAILAYFGWYYLSDSCQRVADLVPNLHDQFTNLFLLYDSSLAEGKA
jgi:cytoskeleton protein RodZ